MGEVTLEEEVASGKDGQPRRPGATSFGAIFRCSDSVDKMLMAVGTIGCVMDGASTPLIMLALSQVMNVYAATSSFTLHDIDQNALNLVYIAVGVGLGAFLEGLCWARTAERQASRMRRVYLNAILSQDVGFLDTRNGGSMTYQVVSSLSADTLTIQGVISEKIPNFLMNISTFFTSQLVAFYLCWRLALVMTPALTLLVAPMIVYGKLLAEVMKKIQKSHMAAGGIAEQALSSIRTVFSYVAESYVEQKFSAALELGLKLGIKQGLMKGMAFGTIGIAYALWSLQAWYGSVLVIGKGAKGGDVFNAGVCIIVGGLALGSSLINLKYFSEATVAAASIFDIIERVPSINSNDQNGKTMEDVKGELEFKNVDFAYPSRPESVVLRKFSLRVMAGDTVGLIGRSGSGKSTIISLIERFYDPIEGEILLDGVCINQLQLNWLRNQISLVNQEPVLFASSIKENIEFGKSETSMEEIVAAAKAANAHDFIVELPDKYDTHVGQLGTQMSGGQKQRIAIARALLRDPKILLLDEATSALDSHSEKAVQITLDKVSTGRTTIIIAHRLSTLRNVDTIAVIHMGQITEFGPYDQLIQDMHNQSAMAHLQRFSIQKENNENIHQMNTTNASYKSSQLQSPNHEDKKIGEKQDQFSPSLHDLIQTTAPEWKTTLLGCGAAFCYGTIQPMHSFCMGSLLSIYFIDNHSQIRTRTRIYCFIFLAYASLAFITNVIQHYNFVVMGEHISKRVHEAVLKKLFTFEVGWFDQEDNNGGALCSRVATEVNILRSLVCDRLSLLAQIISAATLATILGFVLAWRLTIVILALQPLIIGSFYGRGVLMKKMSKKVLKAQNKSGELATEAVISHRVITAFSSQEKIMSIFEKTQKEPKRESRKQSWYAGLGLLISQFLTAANTGLVFWYGGHLLYQGKVTYEHLFQTFFVLVTTGRVIAETGSMTSDLSKGTDAVKSVFMILGRKSKVEPNDPDGIMAEKLIGTIEIKEVSFAYPLRPRQMVLVGLSLTVEAGKTIALVGQSGSGKSTIIGLVERFYDPLKGSIHIDGVDIRRYNLRALREGIGLVSQEPTLFAGTIYENITYGKQSIPEAEVVEAATLANAHEFISGMKDGYQTFCGERGVQLSGGQKQRIALARAILKDPAILLLDEATSALDNISESLVQEAMDKMMVRRTCIVVAHRLSTIQKSDSIAVIENGKVVEEGPHNKLLKKGENGVYYSLVRLQQI